MRYEVSLNRQVEKDIALLERLQKERRAQSTSLDATDSDEDDPDAATTREPVPVDGDGGGSATIVPLQEPASEESLDGAAKHSETENEGTKPSPTEPSQRAASVAPKTEDKPTRSVLADIVTKVCNLDS